MPEGSHNAPVEIDGKELPPLPPQEMATHPGSFPVPTMNPETIIVQSHPTNYEFQFRSDNSTFNISSFDIITQTTPEVIEPPPLYAQRSVSESTELPRLALFTDQVSYQPLPQSNPPRQGPPVHIPYRSVSQRALRPRPMVPGDFQRFAHECLLHDVEGCHRCAM